MPTFSLPSAPPGLATELQRRTECSSTAAHSAEILNSKYEIPNNVKCSKKYNIQNLRNAVSTFNHLNFEFVWDFDIRASNFRAMHGSRLRQYA
jgi:hypothetical protein